MARFAALVVRALALLAVCASLYCVVVNAQLPEVMKISGTFLDVAYDRRMHYTNDVAHGLTCTQWTHKIAAMKTMGIDTVIFQAVHDARWGSYYPSKLPFMKSWNGTCKDVVGTVLSAASTLNMHVFLSCEYYDTEFDTVTDPAAMKGRLEIMQELVQKYINNNNEDAAAPSSFEGWYFSSEAYLTPLFVQPFLDYVNTLAARAKQLTPKAKIFISPYNTRFAVDSPQFVEQLKQLPVDFIAYQDEVGCIRDELPVETAAAAFLTLASAHRQANRSALWANIESFTWQDLPNNDSSPLIPAEFSRIAAQLRSATVAGVQKVITFTAQGIYESPDASIPWGLEPQNRILYDLYMQYTQQLNAGASYSSAPWILKMLRYLLNGSISHAAIGKQVTSSIQPAPHYSAGNLTDGLCGSQTPYDPRWLGYEITSSLNNITLEVDLGTVAVPVNRVAISFLQVPALWYYWGNGLQPQPRNVTGVLPHRVDVFGRANGNSRWILLGSSVKDQSWVSTHYDIHTHPYAIEISSVVAVQQLRVVVVMPKSSTAQMLEQHKHVSAAAAVPTLLVDEIIVNPRLA